MSRTFLDPDLRTWEVYASTGDFGYSEHSVLVFHCLSDPTRRARIVRLDGHKADAERQAATAGAEELMKLLNTAEELR